MRSFDQCFSLYQIVEVLDELLLFFVFFRALSHYFVQLGAIEELACVG
jgi:hypothetical protein